MKFGKRLQQQIEETLPEWRDKFLSYKLLKKRIKLIAAECFTDDAFAQSLNQNPQGHSGESTGSVSGSQSAAAIRQVPGITVQELEFIRLLNLELEKFNSFFIDKEEDYIILLKDLQERIMNARQESAGGPWTEDMMKIWKDLVTFHGLVILLENYSSLNYTGLVKILKKHDRAMKNKNNGAGALLRLPYIRGVLQQPFYTTEVLSELVRDCENNLQALFPCVFLGETVSNPGEPSGSRAVAASVVAAAAGSAEVSEEDEDAETDSENVEDNSEIKRIYRSTVAALHTIHELRKGSSTTATFVPVCSSDENLGVVVDESTVSC